MLSSISWISFKLAKQMFDLTKWLDISEESSHAAHLDPELSGLYQGSRW
jgi:hypothetical protein